MECRVHSAHLEAVSCFFPVILLLVVSSLFCSLSRYAISVDLTKANFTATSANVYDIWNQKNIGVISNSKFATDSIGPHDSRFYIFSPA